MILNSFFETMMAVLAIKKTAMIIAIGSDTFCTWERVYELYSFAVAASLGCSVHFEYPS
jgi:hypothetical protein